MCAEGEQGSGGAREVGRSEGAPGERRSARALGEQGGEGATLLASPSRYLIYICPTMFSSVAVTK